MKEMLVLFSKELRRLDLKAAVPYSVKDIMIFATPNIAFRITNVMNERGEIFSIKAMMEKETVFACPSFEDRFEEFAKVMALRLERHFITKKTEYVFFDEEEQKVLRGHLSSPGLSANVLIYTRAHIAEDFREVDFLKTSAMDHHEINVHMKKLRPVMMVKPETYYHLASANTDRRGKFDSMKHRRDRDVLGPVETRYPMLKHLGSPEQIGQYQKIMAKICHPDKLREDTCYALVNIDFDDVRSTRWYELLKAKSSSDSEQPEQEKNILSLMASAGGEADD